ncbi:MAG: metallophosphoesterase [Vicinamibacterales bacterium]
MRRLFLLVVVLAGLTTAAPSNAGAPTRVISIADVHGGFEPFVAILQRAGLIDAQKKWIGANTVFVQTGDLTDRGNGVRETLELMMSLEQQASAAGGRVHALLGNHEIMNIVGETRDVSPETLAAFGGEAAYRDAFGPTGRYGKWLRTRSPVVKVEDSMFMHAGINPDVTTDSIDMLNRTVRELVSRWDDGVRTLLEKNLVKPGAGFKEIIDAADANKIPLAEIVNSHLFHPEGLMWFRGYSTWPEADGAPRVEALLKRYKVKRIVSGHTVQAKGEITERFGGAIFLIDTGMLDSTFFPGGRPSALEITAAGAKPIYLDPPR